MGRCLRGFEDGHLFAKHFIQDGSTEIGTGYRKDGLAALEGLHATLDGFDERNAREMGMHDRMAFFDGIYRHQLTNFLAFDFRVPVILPLPTFFLQHLNSDLGMLPQAILLLELLHYSDYIGATWRFLYQLATIENRGYGLAV